jgi:diguanylate cyclase (GGDEF)-like protein
MHLIAERIRDSIREVDTVSRLGGDEFIIVLPELHDIADADVIARKMIAIVGTECVVAGQKVRITPSLGSSNFPDHGRDRDTQSRYAD